MRRQFRIHVDPPRKMLVDDTTAAHDAERLLANGFVPREDNSFVREACPACSVCVPIRIPLNLFAESNEHKRILRKNADLEVQYGHGIPNLRAGGIENQVVQLLLKYSAWRFPQRIDLAENKTFDARGYLTGFQNLGGLLPEHIKVKDPATGKLVGLIIYNTGPASAYGSVFFYDPAYRSRGIGHFLVLSSIARLRAERPEVSHYYLATWTRRDSAFSWKVKYPPVELMINGAWTRPMFMPEIRGMRAKDSDAFPSRRNLTPQI